ncbi:uncharacterized protein LOC144658777 [Oculina patagonica]
MKTSLFVFLLLLVLFISDNQVTGKCSRTPGYIADTDLATCLPFVGANKDEGKCPHDFLRLDDDLQCGLEHVCCLLRPTFEINIKDTPCLQGDALVKDRYSKHHN